MNAAGYVSDEKVSVAACVGATWIAGGVAGTIELLVRSLCPGGIILIGEPYWRQLPPTEDVAKACLASSISDFLTLPELLASFNYLGYDVVEMVLADQDGWDRYEAAKWLTMRRWLEANPDDELAKEVRAKLISEPERYATYTREYLGWGVFALIRRLLGNLKRKQKMEIEKIGIMKNYQHKSFVYKLKLSQNAVYMRVDKTNFENEKRYVVLIDIKNYYKYCIKQNHESFSVLRCIFEEDDNNKRKYEAAIEGFKYGIDNPVPLPIVAAYVEKKEIRRLFRKTTFQEKLIINFIDGITRTQWLINNNFNKCPVEVETNWDSAYLIHKYFGIEGTDICTVKELIED